MLVLFECLSSDKDRLDSRTITSKVHLDYQIFIVPSCKWLGGADISCQSFVARAVVCIGSGFYSSRSLYGVINGAGRTSTSAPLSRRQVKMSGDVG